jgi:C-terminal processing protease CtpA/Prc
MDYKKNFLKLLRRGGEQAAEHKRKAEEEQRRQANVISIDERLTGFARLWSEVKYNFAFFDQVPDLDWDEVLKEYMPKIRKEQTTEQYYRLLEQCVARLKDGHTTVHPPRIFRHRAQLPIGLTAVERKPVISEVAEAAAYTQPELKPGLEITHIDGRPVAEILEKEIYPYEAAGTPQNHDRRAFRRLIQGEDGSEAIVRVRNAYAQTRDLKLMYLRWHYPQAPRFEFYNLGEGIAYIALNSFSSNEVSSLFGEAFDEIRQAKGLIIDVRNNGGGSSQHGYAIISRLIDKPIPDSLWKTRKYMPAFRAWGREEQWHEGGHDMIEPKGEKHYTGPVVVLTGPGTVSAAEDFVVALHACGRATLVGEKTTGTTGQPLIIKLPRGGKARICTKRDTYPDGREFVGIGVIPDVEVHPTQESIAAGRDPVLEKAVEVLAKQAGVDSIDAAGLSAEVLSQRRPKAPPQEGQGKLIGILEEAKAKYESLAAAYVRKDWKAVEAHAYSLERLLSDELLLKGFVEFRRPVLKARGELNQQVEYDLLKFEPREKEIETFFSGKTDMENLHRLIYEITDLSDEIQCCAEDGQFDGVHICFAELKKRWELLLTHIN